MRKRNLALAFLCCGRVADDARSSSPGLMPAERVKKGQTGPSASSCSTARTSTTSANSRCTSATGGSFGSWPGSGLTFSEAPSAQWPAGSGVEYLFVAGLWVGALKAGVPAVSTRRTQFEFRPAQDDPIDIMYRAFEGARGGNRVPSPVADDDKRRQDRRGLAQRVRRRRRRRRSTRTSPPISKQMFCVPVHRQPADLPSRSIRSTTR